MRRLGVMSLKIEGLELLLGPEPLAQISVEPELEVPVDKPTEDTPKKKKSRLGAMYDHPALKWPGGERPRIADTDK